MSGLWRRLFYYLGIKITQKLVGLKPGKNYLIFQKTKKLFEIYLFEIP